MCCLQLGYQQRLGSSSGVIHTGARPGNELISHVQRFADRHPFKRFLLLRGKIVLQTINNMNVGIERTSEQGGGQFSLLRKRGNVLFGRLSFGLALGSFEVGRLGARRRNFSSRNL